MHPSVLWSRVSVSVTERVTAIHFLKDTIFTFMGDLAAIHCMSIYFNSGMFISKKLLVLVVRSFIFTVITSIKDLQLSILSMVLYVFTMLNLLSSTNASVLFSAYFRTPVTVKQTSY